MDGDDKGRKGTRSRCALLMYGSGPWITQFGVGDDLYLALLLLRRLKADQRSCGLRGRRANPRKVGHNSWSPQFSLRETEVIPLDGRAHSHERRPMVWPAFVSCQRDEGITLVSVVLSGWTQGGDTK